MTRRRKLYASLAVLGIALVLALVFGVIAHRQAPVSPTQTVPTTWQTARKSSMHELHVERGKVACASCHVTGFDEKPSEATCAGCHADAASHAHVGDPKAPTTCTTCHAFAAGKPEATCIGCHGPSGGASGTDAARAAHALARHVSKDIACAACHDVHGDKAAKPRTVLANCTACHSSVAIEHGRVSSPASDPDGGDRLESAALRFASDALAAISLREAGPSPIGQECSACHAPHAAAAEARAACTTCHVGGEGTPAAEKGAVLLAAFAPRIEPRGPHVAGHAACVTCHEPHRIEKADVKPCADCHEDHRAATNGVGHAACTTCHTPHAPTEAASSCASAGCHAGKKVLAAASVAAHSACESCHDPHEPGKSPALACVRCHSDVESKHPASTSKVTGTSACIGCHVPHDQRAKTVAIATTCSSCHTTAHGDRAFHAGGVACTTCHKPHEFASSLIQNVSGQPTHGMPAPGAKSALCATCHGDEKALVAARPGHAECGACHGAAHTPAKKPACVSCHAAETASAPRGHSVCTTCHDAHSGSLGTHAVCTGCHADKPKEQHGALAGGCASCHTPHGPKGVTKAPACISCHASVKLEGLHSVEAHATSCASCHSSHTPVRSDRATCTTSCHVDRRTHQPEAKLCKGCHLFKE